MSFRYAAGINKPGFDPLAAGSGQYKGIWNVSSQANAQGAGTWPVVPGAPTIGTATAGNTQASVTFTAPTFAGYPATITGYIVTSSPGSITASGASSPVVVTGLTNDTPYTFTVQAINASGTGPSSAASNSVTPTLSLALYAWGTGGSGRLGLGNVTDYSSPKQVGALTTWLLGFGANYHTLAITKAGAIWSWGSNNNGQLGLGNRTNYSSPKQIGGLTTWASVGGAKYQPYSNTSFGIKTDGTLWGWGRNEFGQLGLGNITYYSSPKQVGTLTNWLQASSTYASTLAIKTDGTLWSWGIGNGGALGLGNVTWYSSPKQVGSLTDWALVSAGSNFGLAIKTNGTMWAWGNNSDGRLGINSGTAATSSPQQIGALTTWTKISAGNDFAIAIKTDGTIWSWGGNSSGQLGLGNITNYSSPKQIGALTAWSKVGVSNSFGGAVKNNGTLWTWGWGQDGRLGLGNTTDYSSPKQVGSLTNWYDISSGNRHMIGMVAV
jgi:alpha-tubulin suppressor-like RCC1 family protein